MKTITLCSSAAFYEHVNSLAAQLEAQGYHAIVPATAVKMAKSKNYRVADYKTWYKNQDDFEKKSQLMRGHFEEVARSDAILVVNDEKHGIKGYIGPNVLMEMGLAFYLKKQIYVLNNIDKDMPLYEEIVGMGSIMLEGRLDRIKL